MSKSNHTPGPWFAASEPFDDGTPYHRITSAGRELDISGVISGADAHLIAAAPDLLAACEDALALLRVASLNGEKLRNCDGESLRNCPVAKKLEAAIAKARGN